MVPFTNQAPVIGAPTIGPIMTFMDARPISSFTTKERDLIRRELCRHFGQDPRIADGIFLRTWRGGEHT